MASSGSGPAYKDLPWWKKALLIWTHAGSEHFAKWINDWAFDPLAIMPVAFVVLAAAVTATDAGAIEAVFAVVVALSPLWLPLYLGNFFWVTWMHYIRYKFWFGLENCVLEIQLPPEVTKSPLAMELFLTALHNTGGETTFIARVWKGNFRAVWSLEIASNEGRIGFYIHLRRVWRSIIEARLYGQFPEAKITEVDDYVGKVPFNLDEYDIFGSEYKKDDPQALPIKTYIDYGLDKNPDTPEVQVDPITNLLELLGQVGKDQYFWMQIIVRPYKKDEWYGFYLPGDGHYKDSAKAAIKNITDVAIKRAQELTPDEAEKKKIGSRGSMLMSPGEKDRVEAIERSLTKLLFECGFRVVYIAKKSVSGRDPYHGINNGAVIRFFDAYKYPNYNGLGVTRLNAYFDYPWQDFNDIRKNIERRNAWFRYKHRAYFYVPYDQVPVYMTTEELATIWHFPSSVVKTPALDRVPSRRSEAPINLPTGPANLPV